MDPIRTPRSNTVLTLPGGTSANDLPASKGTDGQDRPMFESVWQPDELERTHLANGAPVILHVWGERHPPVSVRAGVYAGEVKVLHTEHVTRALGYLHSALSERLSQYLLDAPLGPDAGDGPAGAIPTAPEFMDLWTEAVVATFAEPDADADAGPEGPPAGDPTDPRE